MIEKEDYENTGLTVIDDFLDPSLAQQIHTLLTSCDDFNLIEQTRENHYKTVFKNNVNTLPDEEEVYYARFRKSESLSHDPSLDNFLSQIKDIASKLSQESIRYYTKPLCYQMKTEDHMRVHRDRYAGEFGYTYYLTKDWKWDWGGIVHYYIQDEDRMIPIIPKFNRIVIRNEKIKLNHYVSKINTFALCDRWSINGWGATTNLSKKLKNKTIGAYK